MVKKVQAQMSTEVALDMLKASESIKSITTRVNSFTQSWKASEAQMKSAGDYVGAATAKYEGLGKSITAQQDKIAKLRKEQSDLKGNTEETAQEYLKYQRQIDQATTRLSSLEAQQNRAKQSMEYQKSGLAGLQHSFELNNKAIQSHIERLQAEGKSEEAQVAKIKGLDKALDNLTSQYKKQRTETIAAAREFGDTSDEYLKAKTRLNETATAMAKTKTQANELRESMEKKPVGFMVGVRSKLESINEKAKQTSHLFGKIVGANLVANGVINGLTTIQAHFSELTDSVVQYNNKQQVMKSTWDTLTGSASKGQAMVDMGNKLSSAYNQDINVVDELNQQFYHVLDAKAPTEQLTKSVLTMSDTLGLSAENTKRLGTNFTHMMSSGKMQLGDFNMINDQLPMFSERMLDYERKVQHNSKLTMSNMRDQMSAGKIQAKDAEAVMNGLGQKYQSASENLMKTIPGMERSIKTQMPALLNSIYDPIAQMQNPLLGSITKWIGETRTKGLFKDIGKDLAKQINRITTAFGGKKIDISGNLDDWLKKVDKGVNSLGNSIVKNKSSIKGFISTAGILSRTSFDVFVATLKALLPVLTLVGKLAEKYPRTFTAVASSMIITNKASGLLLATMKGFGRLGGIGKLFAFKEAESGAWRLGKVSKAAKSVFSIMALPVKGLVIGAKWVGGKAVTAGKLALNSLKTVGRGIGKALTFTAKIAVKGAQLALKGLLTAAKVTGRGLKAAFSFLKANPFIAIISGVALVVTSLVALYKHNKKFRNFVNGIAKDAKKYIGKAVDAVKNLGKWVGNIGSGAKKGWNNFTKSTSAGAKNAVKSFVSLKNAAGKHLSNLWKSGKSTFSNGWKTVTNASKSGAHNVGNWFSNMSNDTRKKAVQMFNNHKATFKSGYNVLNNLTSTWHDVMTGKWGKLGSDLKNTANSIKSFVHNIFADMYNKLNQMTGGRLGDMVKWWHDKMKAIGDTVSNAKESIHKHFVDLVRDIIKPFNDMLSGLEKGINWVLDKVGASKISGDWKISLPSYAQGTQDTHQGGLAKVNDGNGANYREMYHLPNGEIGMFPAVKNMIVPLPKGTSILDGNKSALLAKMMGIPGYAGGIGDFFSGLWSGAKDVLDDTENILKKPAEFMESLFKHFLGNTSSKISLANDILTNFPKTIAKDAVDWIKKQFQSIANPTGAGVAQWEPIIKAVAASMNFNISGSQVSKLLRQIQTESGGNPTVLQKVHDINSASGHPAQGLLQFIPSTFAHWALKGHTNILNGADQIMAAINALNHGGEGGWKNIGNGHGWENGGIVRNWQYAQIAEHNKPEAVIPLDSAKDSRAWQVLKAVVDAKTGGKSLDSNNTGSTSNADSKIAELTSTVNQMATMMKTIIGLNADQITATKGIIGYDKSAVYHQTSTDQSLAGFQSFS